MFHYQLHKSFTGAAYYQHELLSSDMLIHGFFTRKGGCSTGEFSGLNSSLNSGDLFDNVNQNRQLIKKSLAHKRCQLITLNQVHGNEVIIIDTGNIENAKHPASGYKADGIVTKKKNILLGILTADCAPILMADCNAGVIGACHAGWKGAISGIIENTVLEMCKIGAKTKDIFCVIGPSIEQKSYEVSADFREKILDLKPFALNLFSPDKKKEKDTSHGKFFFDLQGFCATLLKRADINYYKSINVDTYQNHELFYSYRSSSHNGETLFGRQISVIGIR